MKFNPEDITSKHISNKISQFRERKVFGPDKCTVYFRSLFIDSNSLSLERNVKTVVENCVVSWVVHVTKPMLSPAA